MTLYMLRFADEKSSDHALVGGKGANLGLLTGAGFPVPPGFTVTTEGYAEFVGADGLQDKIEAIVAGTRFDDVENLESATAQIRDLIVGQPMPSSLVEEITAAYRELGTDPFVAVRSSGTAEDLEGASFAGLHDTYLDITGIDGVLDGIRRCWASLWTARATSYRDTKGFGATSHGIAVVVQTMVPSEVSGVLFTANPVSAATDELVVNASWGLGEAIVQGVATPDEYLVAADSLRVKERTLGTKEVRCVRDPETGVGTVMQAVPRSEQDEFTLSDAQTAQLAELGMRVQKYYNGVPQDIEWGWADGSLYLLQARPITGVNFSWDSDVDDWQWLPEADDDTVWTRSWSDEVWTGAITPLMYSFRARGFTLTNEYSQNLWGFSDLARQRMWKYHKGGALYNANLEKSFVSRSGFPQFRPALLGNVPPAWHQEVLAAPFSVATYLKLQARCQFLDQAHGVTTWQIEGNRWIHERKDEADGHTDEELRRLSDQGLVRHIEKLTIFEAKYITDVWSAFFVHARDSLSLLGWIMAHWYDGGEVELTDLITGVPRPTATMVENTALFVLTKRISESTHLSALFAEHTDGDFLTALEDSEEGRAWLADYRVFLSEHGHRGHADRDVYFVRRAEDPAVDYRSIGAMLRMDMSVDPATKEHEVELRRQANIEKVVENMRRKAFGGLRVDLFRTVLNFVIKFLLFRDDERHFIDRSTFSLKRGFKEISRRLLERGVLETDRDYFFLTQNELYGLLNGTLDRSLVRAKVHARARNFDEIESRTRENPLYLQRGRDVEHVLGAAAGATDGTLIGLPTSRGQIEGVARVVKELKDIGRVERGEILVTNSTDPGWTPVFLLISGIVLETGGMLAHGSCLAREYGFPAVQLPRAMQIIPDGARISVNGDTGQVTVLDESSVEPRVEEPLPA